MIKGLSGVYDDFCKKILDTGENKISYNEGGNYHEYTEGYAFRDLQFQKKINEIIEKPYFKKVFLIVTSAILSSNNEEQFLNLLDRYLSGYFSKELLLEGEDLIEKKTFVRADLNFIEDIFLKQKLILEKFDWRKFDNSSLVLENNDSIFTIVNYIYTEIESKILIKKEDEKKPKK